MSLKNLIALQSAAKGKQVESPTDSGAVRHEAASTGQAVEHDDSNQSDAVSPDENVSSPADAASGIPAKPAPRAGLGLNIVGASRAVGGGRSAATPARPKPKASSAAQSDTESGADAGAVFGLADLAGFEASDESAPARSTLEHSGFQDEIEATAPERALEPDLTVQQLQFVESLDGIYPVLHDPDLFAQSVRMIMLELQDHPEYKKLVADEDVHIMIRGMRNTMGLAQIRKTEKTRKTSKGKVAGKSKLAADDLALLDSLMGGE